MTEVAEGQADMSTIPAITPPAWRKFYWVGKSSDFSDVLNWVERITGTHPKRPPAECNGLGYDPELYMLE